MPALEEFYEKTPPFTRFWLIGSLILAAGASSGLISPYYLYLDFE